MKILQKLGEDLVPLSRQQNLGLLIIIACLFQFVLFYAPALADEAVNRASSQAMGQEAVLINDSVVKAPYMDQEAAKIAGQGVATSTPTGLPADIDPATVATSSAPTVKVIRTSTHVITAYNSEAAQTDDSPCITANGFNVCTHGVEDTIAANFLKFGTKVQIPELFGDRVFVVRDRMNKRYTNHVDVWMKAKSDAKQFGVKVAKIHVVEITD
jgi:3D (Asp-Asp-Asp) domain-containing protein